MKFKKSDKKKTIKLFYNNICIGEIDSIKYKQNLILVTSIIYSDLPKQSSKGINDEV